MSEVVYLVRCGECGFLGGPDVGACAKCGYDGGFLPDEVQNAAGLYVPLSALTSDVAIDAVAGHRVAQVERETGDDLAGSRLAELLRAEVEGWLPVLRAAL